MTARDRFSVPLKCPKCGLEGTARLSQEDGWSFMRGNRATAVDEMPHGFKAVVGSCSYANDLDIVCGQHGVSAVGRSS